jgi:hypothetical protein
MKIYTKNELIDALRDINQRGWIPNARPGNAGGIGNTLEDLLEIEENNLPLPNAAEWELKSQRSKTRALITLFHMEPSPRALRFVPKILLPKYGWAHKKAGTKYPPNEMSFRLTINAQSRSDRGFGVVIDRDARKVLISFDRSQVAPRHQAWLQQVESNIGLNELNPQPYWGFDDLFHKAATKLHNCFFVQADVRRKRNPKQEFYHYNKLFILRGLNQDKLINALERGHLLIDFDARTGHNHGTKFRIRRNRWSELYEEVEQIF